MTEPAPGEFNTRSVSAAIACATSILLGPGPAIVAGLGLLLTAVASDFGWSRTTFSAIPLLTAWAAALTSPLFGRWMDKYGLRRVLLPGIVGFGLGFLCIALVPKISWMFFGAYLIVGIMAGSQGPVGYNKIICQWFTRYRGTVIALAAAAGSGLGYALMPQVVNYMIVHHGWRGAYAAVALAILLVSFPVSFFLLRERPRPVEAEGAPNVASESDQGLSRAEAMHTASFWKLALVLFLAANVYYGVMLHLFPMLLDRGIDRTSATGTISMLAIGALLGQLSASYLLDRVASPKIALLYLLIGLGGVLLIHHGVGPIMLLAGAVMIGFGQGAELSVIGYITSRLFGLRSFGALYGLIYAGGSAAAGIGPMIMGYSFDRLGSYNATLYGGEVALLVAIALVTTLRPYAFGGRSKRTTDGLSIRPAVQP